MNPIIMSTLSHDNSKHNLHFRASAQRKPYNPSLMPEN